MSTASPGFRQWLRTVPPSDPLVALLLSNAVTIVLALVQGWDFATVFLVYWFQSVTIGFFTVIQLLYVPITDLDSVSPLPEFARPGDGEIRKLPERTGRIVEAAFFAFHFGGYHLLILAFIGAVSMVSGIAFPPMGALLIPMVLFFFTHLYSAWYYWPRNGLTRMQMGDLFLQPYARVIPMQAVATLGFLVSILSFVPSLEIPGSVVNRSILLIFLLAKMYMDVRAHRKKHASPVRYRWTSPGSGTVR